MGVVRGVLVEMVVREKNEDELGVESSDDKVEVVEVDDDCAVEVVGESMDEEKSEDGDDCELEGMAVEEDDVDAAACFGATQYNFSPEPRTC
jgi:hypothetical protein